MKSKQATLNNCMKIMVIGVDKPEGSLIFLISNVSMFHIQDNLQVFTNLETNN